MPPLGLRRGRRGQVAAVCSGAARFLWIDRTEAEILNTFALRCGTRLMWDLCFNGLTLGEAFEGMQHADDLFPLSLFYTCYAERSFRLQYPIELPKAA